MPLLLPVHYSYGILALLISLTNNVFLLFYVTTFMTVYQIDSTSFYIGEALFLVWNSVNDPLFGWISDSKALHQSSSKTSQKEIVLKRINALMTFGPLFAISFLMFWFKFFPVGIQFCLALCLYDSFLTMVDLHHQALLADLVIDADDRVRLNSYCSMFSAAGSVSVFISFALWDKNDMFRFQVFCLFISAFVCIGFYICCESMKVYYQTYYQSTQVLTKATPVKKTEKTLTTTYAMKKYSRQVMSHKNFLVFAAMNLIQVFHCHFNSNFFPLFLRHLLGHTLSPSGGALLLGFSFLVPHINNLYFLQLCKVHGTYYIIKALFIVKLVLALVMWRLGTGYWYLLCFFIVSNRVFTEGTCKLLNLIISDLVDEDFVKFKRTSPVSALVFGTAALLSKPGQTFAPLLGSYLLYLQSGKSLFLDSVTASNDVDIASDTYETHKFQDACFDILVFVPIVCALIQLFIWKFYTLKGRYLKNIKLDRCDASSSFLGVHIV